MSKTWLGNTSTKYPTLASVPIIIYEGKALSIGELNQKDITLSFETEKSNVDESYTYALAIAYYTKLASVKPVKLTFTNMQVSIVGFGIPTMSPQQALDEISKNTKLGQKLVRMYAGLRMEVLNKLG